MASPSDIKRHLEAIAKKAGLSGEFTFDASSRVEGHSFLEGYLTMPFAQSDSLISDPQRFKMALALIGRYIFRELKAPSACVMVGTLITVREEVVRTPEAFATALLPLLKTTLMGRSLRFFAYPEHEKR
jgi:hypothetical protein